MVKDERIFKVTAIFQQKRQERAPKALQRALAQLTPQEKNHRSMYCVSSSDHIKEEMLIRIRDQSATSK